jgi:hypothetical protein
MYDLQLYGSGLKYRMIEAVPTLLQTGKTHPMALKKVAPSLDTEKLATSLYIEK